MTKNSEVNYKNAIQAFKEQEFEKAVELLRKVVDEDPNNVKAWLCLAEIYGSFFNFDDAIETIQKLNKIKSGKIEPHKYYIDDNEYVEILYNEFQSLFEEVVEQWDWYPATFLFFISNKSWREYIKLFNRFLKKLSLKKLKKLNEGLNEYRISILWFNIMLVYLFNEPFFLNILFQIDDAIDAGEKAVELNPEFKYGWTYLSMGYLRKKEFSNALDAINRALELDDSFKFAIKVREAILNQSGISVKKVTPNKKLIPKKKPAKRKPPAKKKRISAPKKKPEVVKYKGKEYFTINGISTFNTIIDLSHLGISDIAEIEGLENLTQLERLILKNNNIEKISGLSNLKNLKHLDLSFNKIRKIEGLENLSKLGSLNLSKNRIEKIEGLDNLTNLRSLRLIDNRISEISGLDNLSNLHDLFLIKNYNIKEIKGLDNLSGLKSLYLDNNCISKIKGLSKLINLEKLSIVSNRISKIEGLNTLKKLRGLFLNDNKIEKIEGLHELENLSELSLNKNAITEMEGLENLKGLAFLHLAGNKISKVRGLENLENLNRLDLSGNNISKVVGRDFENNKFLLKLRLDGNAMSEEEATKIENRIAKKFDKFMEENPQFGWDE